MSRPNPSGIPEDDIINPKLNVSCLDFLLIELVPLAQRITDQLHAREQALIEEFRRSKIFNNSNSNGSSTTTPSAITTTQQSQSQTQSHPTGSLPTVPEITTTSNGAGNLKKTSSEAGAEASTTTTTNTATGTAATSVISTSNIGGAPLLENSSTREAVFWRLDNLGYRVGQGLIERFSQTKPRPQTPLEAIKFICKDLWTILFRKQIDNLKTNHRGVFVLTDSRFQPISRMSVDRRAGPRAGEDALRRGQAGLGIEVTVTAETTEIPVATFQIKMKGAKA
ncbi:hypothetical protein CBER1_10432 [Cercospora berteroae]|uniref:Transport protein particle component n=1 Tax=Cercospora berteroae TaxID=357750 RepID=A0A2S6CE32_9PEZI|nr:hypothetical protein CBER1_10432 [Cercospora berteroae]